MKLNVFELYDISSFLRKKKRVLAEDQLNIVSQK